MKRFWQMEETGAWCIFYESMGGLDTGDAGYKMVLSCATQKGVAV
jgi:hypothetical protein